MAILSFIVGAIMFSLAIGIVIGGLALISHIPILINIIFGIMILFALIIMPIMFYMECKRIGEETIVYIKSKLKKKN